MKCDVWALSFSASSLWFFTTLSRWKEFQTELLVQKHKRDFGNYHTCVCFEGNVIVGLCQMSSR